MSLRFAVALAAFLLPAFVGGAAGQATPASSVGTGTVTGHVVCDDTQRPARFAGVILFGVPAQVTVAPATPPDAKDTAALRKALNAGLGHVNLAQTKTGVDGSFVLNNVPPGDYYAFASMPGYISGAAVVQSALRAGADLKKPLPGVPVVHVAADRTAVAEVTAQRGASVSGRVLWDDGTPMAQVVLQALAQGKEATVPPEFSMLVGMSAITAVSGLITDDQGRFRLVGLEPGEYVLKASLSLGMQVGFAGGAMQMNSMMDATPMVVYAPDTVHRTSAKSFTLAKGEERTGADITVRLGGMRTVSGRIRAASDGHGINSAVIKLTDASDPDFSRATGVDADGAFALTLIPAGSYKVAVSDAEDTRPSTKKGTGLFKLDVPETVRSYEDARGTVVVTDADLAGQNFDLKASETQTKKPALDDLLKKD